MLEPPLPPAVKLLLYPAASPGAPAAVISPTAPVVFAPAPPVPPSAALVEAPPARAPLATHSRPSDVASALPAAAPLARALPSVPTVTAFHAPMAAAVAISLE